MDEVLRMAMTLRTVARNLSLGVMNDGRGAVGWRGERWERGERGEVADAALCLGTSSFLSCMAVGADRVCGWSNEERKSGMRSAMGPSYTGDVSNASSMSGVSERPSESLKLFSRGIARLLVVEQDLRDQS